MTDDWLGWVGAAVRHVGPGAVLVVLFAQALGVGWWLHRDERAVRL